MKILCWNVNGIRAAKKHGFLEWLYRESPDILCIQETKAQLEQLNKDLERLGTESYHHHSWIGQLITQLGGKPDWTMDIVDRLVDVDRMLALQLEKEKTALSLYQEAMRIAERNKAKVQVRDFLGRLIRMEDELPIDVVNVNDILGTLERIATDEKHHIKLVHNSIATLDMHMNK